MGLRMEDGQKKQLIELSKKRGMSLTTCIFDLIKLGLERAEEQGRQEDVKLTEGSEQQESVKQAEEERNQEAVKQRRDQILEEILAMARKGQEGG